MLLSMHVATRMLNNIRACSIVECICDSPLLFTVHSENHYGSTGLSKVLHSLAYNPVLEELSLTKMSISSNMTQMSEALTFLFSLTVSLKKVTITSTRGCGAVEDNTFVYLCVGGSKYIA